MTVTRAHVEATKAFFRPRFGNPYIYAGALSPAKVKQGTDCSEAVQTAAELVLGRYKPGRQSEGATTESYRRKRQGGGLADGAPGPFGTISVRSPRDIPPDAPLKIALHHGGGGPNSHMWCEVDGMRIESRGGGVGLITNPRAYAIDASYGNDWCYLPGPIVEDGTPAAPEVITLGRRYESYGDRVRQLQVALNSYGARLDADGEFGPLTEQSVISFQRASNLEADGVAGPVTLGALGLTFGGAAAPVNLAPSSLVALFRRAMEPTEQTNTRLGELLPHYQSAMVAAEITNPRRAAAWNSQLGHEGAGGKYMAEIQTSGPDWSWDRTRYRGRGPIQLTWEGNYRRFGQWCAAKGYVTDPELFVKQPELVEQPRWGYLAASWYWLNAGPKPGQINAFADAGDIEAVSRCINGWIKRADGSLATPIGMADRRTRYLNSIALGDQVMDLARPPTPTDELEELLAMKIQSRSPYAKPGEAPVDAAVMIATSDMVAHRLLTEEDARDGDINALRDLARTAAGQGPNPTAARIRRATRILNEINATNPEFILAATPGKA
ncbi:hypothetical protein BH11ACT6_BH11ACT6_35040 [soil metagenome]